MKAKTLQDFEDEMIRWMLDAEEGYYEMDWIFTDGQPKYRLHFWELFDKLAWQFYHEWGRNEAKTKFRVRWWGCISPLNEQVRISHSKNVRVDLT